MNCSTFKKYLKDYMEGEVFLEVKEAMEEHLNGCRGCKKLYEEEKSIDDVFYSVLAGENIRFNSSRTRIINHIDKKRYSKNPIVKIKYAFIKNRFKVITAFAAALFIFTVFSSDILNQVPRNNNIAVNSTDKISANIENKTINDNVIKESTKAMDTIPDYSQLANRLKGSMKIEEGISIPEFIVQPREQGKKYEYPSSWKTSPSRKFSALLDGKGEMLEESEIVEGVFEEGVSTIVIKDNKLNQYRDINIVNKSNQTAAYSPLFIEWADDENLFIIVGLAHGTVVRGGDLYLLNINTGKTTLVYKTSSNKESVATVKKLDKVLELNMAVYDDDEFLKLHTEKKKITFDFITMEDMAKNSLPQVAAVLNFSEAVTSKDYNKAKSMFLADYDKNYKDRLGELSHIKSIKINKIIRIDSTIKDLLKDYKTALADTYCAEVEYSFDDAYKGPVKRGINNQRIIMVKVSEKEEWKIADIFTAPQS
ncbi:DUF4652 domain-containing protein [Clostridium polynesiense]|uniref:DUF4652 domain-containing protein n=1 Tax=Clostridium polynesiense TaxID=1325933 RepID=UPI00058F201E|nr:DUF4652 domain-containing protein [Clostridium polynesiense]